MTSAFGGTQSIEELEALKKRAAAVGAGSLRKMQAARKRQERMKKKAEKAKPKVPKKKYAQQATPLAPAA